jgi:hypothetical protein
MKYGSVTTAFYPVKVRTGGTEHQSQANQFAIDHESIAIIDGEIVAGRANPINTIPVWDTLKTICEKATALLKEYDLINDTDLFKVNDIAFLTHGTDDQLEIGVVSGGYNGWVKNSYADFAKKISLYLADVVKVLIYGCSVAGAAGTVDPFAEKFRKEILASLEGIYGVDKPVVEVWGHKDVGHTTANDRLVQFAGSGTYNGGDSLLDDFAYWTYFDKLTARGIDPDTFADAAKTKKLIDASYAAMLRALQAAGPAGEDRDKSNKAYTSPNHPVNTLIREIPYIGIATLWNDIHAATSDYSYLVVTPDTCARLIEGVQIKRERFNSKYAELDKIFDQTL